MTGIAVQAPAGNACEAVVHGLAKRLNDAEADQRDERDDDRVLDHADAPVAQNEAANDLQKVFLNSDERHLLCHEGAKEI